MGMREDDLALLKHMMMWIWAYTSCVTVVPLLTCMCRWFYRDLSVEQACIILRQSQSSAYLVSNVAATGDFLLIIM